MVQVTNASLLPGYRASPPLQLRLAQTVVYCGYPKVYCGILRYAVVS